MVCTIKSAGVGHLVRITPHGDSWDNLTVVEEMWEHGSMTAPSSGEFGNRRGSIWKLTRDSLTMKMGSFLRLNLTNEKSTFLLSTTAYDGSVYTFTGTCM
jgi:hypothetical protein